MPCHTPATQPHPPTRLIVPQPNAAVGNAEGEHVVAERLALVVAPRRGERLRQQLLEQLQVRLLVKRLHARPCRLSRCVS